MARVKSFDEMYYVYDPFLKDYLIGKTIVDFVCVDSKVAYNNFLTERVNSDVPEMLSSSMRTFNRAIRDRFPTLELRHIYKKGQNAYVWMVKD